MPYLITSSLLSQYAGTGALNPSAIRAAEPTLDAARTAAYRAMCAADPDDELHPERYYEALELPARGGTIRDLPDGTMIEVKTISWPVLREAEQKRNGKRLKLNIETEPDKLALIAAYNGSDT